MRAASHLVCGEGQSLWTATSETGWTMRQEMAARLGKGVTLSVPALGGYSWTMLSANFDSRVGIYGRSAPVSIMAQLGGTSDIYYDLDGVKAYHDAGIIATKARAAGFDYIIGATITDSTAFFGSMIANRVTANNAIRANADGYFDYVIDFDSVAGINDPTVNYPTAGACYVDGLHWSNLGMSKAGDEIEVALKALVPGIPLV